MAFDRDGDGTLRRASCPLNMRRHLSLSVTWLLGLCLNLVPIHSFAMEPKRPGQENSLSRAVFSEGRLWLLSDAGELSSLKEGEKKRIGVDLPEPALDLWPPGWAPRSRHWSVSERQHLDDPKMGR